MEEDGISVAVSRCVVVVLEVAPGVASELFPKALWVGLARVLKTLVEP